MIAKAIEHAVAIREGAELAGPRVRSPVPTACTRRVAIGDPQSNTARFFGALAAHDLLGDDGWMKPDVQLVAMGDYFDYRVAERDAGRVEGVLILGWLAAHANAGAIIMAAPQLLPRSSRTQRFNQMQPRASPRFPRSHPNRATTSQRFAERRRSTP